MKSGTIHFSLQSSRGRIRLTPSEPEAVKRLTFREGSELFQQVMKTFGSVLRRKQLAVHWPAGPVDTFGVLTGITSLAVTPIVQGNRVIRLPTICIDCTGDGGCREVACKK